MPRGTLQTDPHTKLFNSKFKISRKLCATWHLNFANSLVNFTKCRWFHSTCHIMSRNFISFSYCIFRRASLLRLRSMAHFHYPRGEIDLHLGHSWIFGRVLWIYGFQITLVIWNKSYPSYQIARWSWSRGKFSQKKAPPLLDCVCICSVQPDWT